MDVANLLACLQDVVPVGVGLLRDLDVDLEPAGQACGESVGGSLAGAVRVIVGEDHQALDLGRRLEPFNAAIIQRRPGGDAEYVGCGEGGLDAFSNTENPRAGARRTAPPDGTAPAQNMRTFCTAALVPSLVM